MAAPRDCATSRARRPRRRDALHPIICVCSSSALRRRSRSRWASVCCGMSISRQAGRPLRPKPRRGPRLNRSCATIPITALSSRRSGATLPADAAASLDQAAQASGSDAVAQSVDQAFQTFMLGLRRRRGVLAGKAGDAALTALFDARLQLLDALSRADARLCVDYLFGAQSEAFIAFAGRASRAHRESQRRRARRHSRRAREERRSRRAERRGFRGARDGLARAWP